ncbi:MAG: DUF2808 domain-containing protein [Synechococcus sp.]|nr:DUF2808 domain-containing protein [Synechococcus sp.]
MINRNRNTTAPLLQRVGQAGGLISGLATAGILGTVPVMDALQPAAALAQATTPLMQMQWDCNEAISKSCRTLYYFQSSTRKLDRAEYFFMLRPKDRNTAIVNLTIEVPEHFNAKIKSKRVSLCRMELGGMLARSRCKESIPAVIEATDNAIEVIPNKPIPTDGTYAVVMKVFNPSNSGMFRFLVKAQEPGDVPLRRYLGHWSIDID